MFSDARSVSVHIPTYEGSQPISGYVPYGEKLAKNQPPGQRATERIEGRRMIEPGELNHRCNQTCQHSYGFWAKTGKQGSDDPVNHRCPKH